MQLRKRDLFIILTFAVPGVGYAVQRAYAKHRADKVERLTTEADLKAGQR